MADGTLEEEASSGEITHLPNIVSAPIPEVEAVLRTADHWHFDAFRLTEVSQGYPLSTLGFWLIQQSRVAKEFSEFSTLPAALIAAGPARRFLTKKPCHLLSVLLEWPRFQCFTTESVLC